jgi:hypothetical protein
LAISTKVSKKLPVAPSARNQDVDGALAPDESSGFETWEEL